MKGIRGHILRRTRNGKISDCTNDGITSRHDDVILVGPNVPQEYEARDDGVLILIEREVMGRKFWIAAPIDAKPSGFNGGHPYMFGGNYVVPSYDSLDFNYPIKVFDRKE